MLFEIERLIWTLCVNDIVPCLKLLRHSFGTDHKEANSFIDLREDKCEQTTNGHDSYYGTGWHCSSAGIHLLLHLVVLSKQVNYNQYRPNQK